MRQEIFDRRGHTAVSVGTGHPILRLPARGPPVIDTTNAIQTLNMRLRNIVKNRGHFPTDEAATKLLYLALRDMEKDWKMLPITC